MVSIFFDFNKYFIHFGTGLAFLLSVISLLKKENGKSDGGLFIIGLCIGSIMLRIGFYVTGALTENTFGIFLLLPSLYALGPSIFILANKMLDFALQKKRILSSYYHFIPVLFLFLIEIFFFHMKDPGMKHQILYDSFSQVNITWLNILIFFGAVHILTYLCYLLFLNYQLRKKFELSYNEIVHTIIIVPLSGISILILGYFLKVTLLVHLGGDLLTITCILFFIIPVKSKNFFSTLQKEIKSINYERTQLTGINLNAIKKRLNELIEDEKIYLNENLKLSHLAADLLIHPNQLSRIINEKYNKSFSEFINYYRIEEAKRILIRDKKKTILSVAFESGFGTKSAFNIQFRKFTKKSPSEYRQKNTG